MDNDFCKYAYTNDAYMEVGHFHSSYMHLSYMRASVYAHIWTTDIRTTRMMHIWMRTFVNAHIWTLATSIMASFLYALFHICAYKCAFTDDNFLKCAYIEARIYGRCIWIIVNLFCICTFCICTYMDDAYTDDGFRKCAYTDDAYMEAGHFHNGVFHICALLYMRIYR
jgi:hypothetical protein